MIETAKKKPGLFNALILLTIPIMIGQVLEASMEIVDMHFVGELGQVSIAGCSLATTVVMFCLLLVMGVAMGMSAYISRAYGAGEKEKISTILYHALFMGMILSILIAVVGLIFTDDILMFLSHGDVAAAVEGTAFLCPELLFFILIVLIEMMTLAYQAVGDAVTPTIVLAIVNILNAILNPILIGQYGLAGSAYATLIARGLGGISLVVLLYVLKKPKEAGLRFPKKIGIHGSLILGITKVALPSSVQTGVRSFSLLLITFLVAFYGESAIAAYGICTRLDNVCLIIGVSFALAVSILVGQYIGGGRVSDAEKTVRYSVIVNIILMGAIAVFLSSAAPLVISFFGGTGDVLSICQLWFAFIPFISVLMDVAVIFCLAMTGAGVSWPGMVSDFAGYNVVPISMILIGLSLNYPILWVFVSIGIGMLTTFVISMIFYCKCGWKTHNIYLEKIS